MSAATNGGAGKQRNQDDDARNGLFSRRDSIAVAGQEFQKVLVEKLMELRSIWDEVGMTEQQRRDRMDAALGHLTTLLSDMVDEEVAMRHTLRTNFEASKAEVETLLDQLRHPVPLFLLDAHSYTLLQLEEQCRKLQERLIQERDALIQERDCLLAEYKVYTYRNGLGQRSIDTATLPNAAMLDHLRQEVAQLKKCWETNIDLFEKKQVNIMEHSKKIQLATGRLTAFQRDILTGNGLPAGHEPFLSAERMTELQELDDLVQQAFDAYLADIRQRIDGVHKVLVTWWDQCHVPQSERDRFLTVDPETYPEQAIEQYTEAIAHWRSFYESRKSILDKVGEWEALWKEHIDFEEREGDVNRYYNRGGALLAEEKRKKKVLALLAEVYKELKSLVAEYDADHDTPFAMGGLPLLDYIESVEAEHREKKRKEKEEKELLKKQQLMNERMYGSASTTPGVNRKRFGSVNAGTPPSPATKGLLSAGSKPFIHSSLINLRSPGAKNGPNSSTKKPPGLPAGNSQKRKGCPELQGTRPGQNQAPPSSCDGNRAESSTGSYGDFAKDLRAKGVEVQSSFIGCNDPRSPQKMARLN